jgi:hypothetical protein
MDNSEGLSKIPDWLPDWTDIKKYPNPKNTDSRVWTWEFLRRNTKYQQLYSELATLPPSIPRRDDSVYKISERLEKEFGVLIPASPSMTSSDPLFDRQPQFITHGRRWMKPPDWPEDADPYVVDETCQSLTEVLIEFDLRWSLQSQLISAKAFLNAYTEKLESLGILEKPTHRMKPEHFQNYLRLLDADVTGHTLEKMAKIIFGVAKKYPDNAGVQKAHDGLKRARWLRDKGYRYIAMAPQA